MKTVLLKNSRPNGTVVVPPSKSAAHRALFCSFLAGGGDVSPIIDSNDMKATVGVLDALKGGKETLDCIESGSTLRFAIPVAAALGKAFALWAVVCCPKGRSANIFAFCRCTVFPLKARAACLLK